VHGEVLSLMDRALVRGARHFSQIDETRLRVERNRWQASGGSAEGCSTIDEFLTVVTLARGGSDIEVKRLDARVYGLKATWRNILPSDEKLVLPSGQ